MSLPLYLTGRVREIEAAAARDLSPGTLMQRAGEAAARHAVRRFAAARRIAVLCGPGNNGGDGYACAVALQARGREPLCVALAPPSTGDARAAEARWRALGGQTVAHVSDSIGADLIVDAMFGIGLARPLAGTYVAAVDWLNATRLPVLALDMPSGLDADRGVWIGDRPGVQADATISFLGAKPGLFTADGIEACGDVVIDSLALALPASEAALVEPGLFPEVTRLRRPNTHKGSFGSVQVIGGAPGMLGAALLAARAALRLGAGRVYVDALDAGSRLPLDPVAPELMIRRSGEASLTQVIGCGLGDSQAAHERLRAGLATSARSVLDADALNLIASEPALRAALPSGTAVRVLTPHPLEAARLLDATVGEVQADRVAAARALARQFSAWVVLKGAGSVIAAPRGDHRWWINPTGSPALATAGSGDVLAGMLGALLAQVEDPAQAVLGAVWLHGRAAEDFAQDIGLVAGELPVLAARALARLRNC
jgi:hydroxyethylthiazole kinase-like uncharacterized protein yjeF